MGSSFRSCFSLFIAVVVCLILLIVFAQGAGASVSQTWENVKNSEAVQHAQKEWTRSKTKAQNFVDKATSGKLSDDITMYIDNTLVKYFGIRVNELQKTLKKAQQTWLGPTLLVLWVFLGLVTAYLTSLSSCLVVLSVTMLLHSLYGPVVIFTQVVIFTGLCMYFASLVTNNIILTAGTIVAIYLSSIVFGFCRRGNSASQSMLYDLEDRVVDLGERTADMERKLDGVDEKLDLLIKDRA